MDLIREQYSISALELAYLSSLVEGGRVPGVEIDFETDTEAMLRSKMDVQQRSLEKQGLIEVGFDGTVSMNAVLLEFITLASHCEVYYCQFNQLQNEVLQRTYFFVQDSHFFKMCYDAERDQFVVQQLYGFHEVQLSVIDRFPLIEGSIRSSIELEEGPFKEWLEEGKQNGAILSSLARFEWKDEKNIVSNEFSLFITQDLMWKIENDHQNKRSSLSALTIETALDEIYSWMKAEMTS